MSDLVERLRKACNGHPHAEIAWPHRVLHEAADEIERLQRQNEWLKDRLTDLQLPPDSKKNNEEWLLEQGMPQL